MAKIALLLTEYVPLRQLWHLVEQQGHHIHSSHPLFEVPCAMRNDLDRLFDEALVRGDLAIPTIDKLFHYYGNHGVEL